MLDLTDPEQNLRAFVRVRASLAPTDTVCWWTGNVYAQVPHESYRHLFRFEGFNIGSIVAIDSGYRFLAREAAFYQDPRTSQILDTWDNPFTGQACDVLHVWNDPVNMEFLLNGPRGPWQAPVTDVDDNVIWPMNITLAYPSPLPTADYPESSADDTYRAAEFFQFFSRRSDLEQAEFDSVPCQFSWSRLSPWLPWMRMGNRPGGLAYHCHGIKLSTYDDLPKPIRKYVQDTNPIFQQAPDSWSTPNETSWTYYRKRHPNGSGCAV